ncbi:hypothetical protein [Falsirhodobacter sp. 20TX0035]|uniref:hypothetical protein n=1 Tax=Falsirhodobacter sp. 20TX0035 TaxID=3022019 RepID=UPI00232DDB6D|nr:hypothetical protein [Falsirhodobacter sp. 20TX0035]MDB6452832.1 hypothetical protein [Falsirhodobacter sp. 20TX0035]
MGIVFVAAVVAYAVAGLVWFLTGSLWFALVALLVSGVPAVAVIVLIRLRRKVRRAAEPRRQGVHDHGR